MRVSASSSCPIESESIATQQQTVSIQPLLCISLVCCSQACDCDSSCPALRQSHTDANTIMNDVTTKMTAEPEQQALVFGLLQFVDRLPRERRDFALTADLAMERGMRLFGCFPIVGIQAQL